MKNQFYQKVLVTLITLYFSNLCFSQSVTINPSDPMGIIDTKSTTKGILPPRMSVAQRNLIPLSAGLQVYCTDCSPAGPYSYNGSAWLAMFQTTVVSPITYTVGQFSQGGIVFWVDETGQHGLVASTSDLGAGSVWYQGFTNTKAIRSGIFGGFYNTERILSSIGYGACAASVAAQHIGIIPFGDWYLPSQAELVALNNSGLGLLSGTYWSSTEIGVETGLIADQALALTSAGDPIPQFKNVVSKVRAIRKF